MIWRLVSAGQRRDARASLGGRRGHGHVPLRLLCAGLTETSRLGCQIIATKEIDGVRLRIPAATRNMAVDGYVPKPH